MNMDNENENLEHDLIFNREILEACRIHGFLGMSSFVFLLLPARFMTLCTIKAPPQQTCFNVNIVNSCNHTIYSFHIPSKKNAVVELY